MVRIFGLQRTDQNFKFGKISQILETGIFHKKRPARETDMHHYAMASGGEVVVQVHGQAPLQFNYVDPNDDPSKKK
jgi:hypothetical protein